MGSQNRSIRFKIFLLLLLPLLSLSALWGFALNLTVGDGQALLRADTLYRSIGVTSTDLGFDSTHSGDTFTPPKSKSHRLAYATHEVPLAELGDGILGEYGVQDILRDPELMGVGAAYVMAAPDPVACWGATELMQRDFGLPITAITGPATDNEVGQVYITTILGLPAHNARRDANGLLTVVRQAIAAWTEKTETTERYSLGPTAVSVLSVLSVGFVLS